MVVVVGWLAPLPKVVPVYNYRFFLSMIKDYSFILLLFRRLALHTRNENSFLNFDLNKEPYHKYNF